MTDSTCDTPVGTHTVFISHRGIQMKLGFANQLYYALDAQGISAFLDMDTLPKGDDVRKYMLEAARRATIHVPIFTEEYGNSEWCLDELIEMMDSKRSRRGKVFPVFFDVKPEDLRKREGPFAQNLEAFLKSCNRGEDRIKRWRDALLEASWLEGFRPEMYGRALGALTKALVDRIRKELDENVRVDTVVPKPVGLDFKIKDVVQEFCLHEKDTVYFVLVWAMGGVGKTTLARATFESLKKDFEAASFIENCAVEKPIEIQNRLRADLLRDNNDMRGDLARGLACLHSGLSHRKVLIVLDDMKEYFDVETVITPTKLCAGSRILVTSRDRRVFPHENSISKVFRARRYELEKMADRESWQLFCYHAFNKPDATPEFQTVAKNVVEACDGVPLALEVLGRHLSQRKTERQWNEAISKLRHNKYQPISGKLMISYEALDAGEQKMFQDVACFLIGENEQTARAYWDGWINYYETGLENLIQLSLVKVDKECLAMHDLLRDLGRDISKSSKTRVWNDEDVQLLKHDTQGLDRILGLRTSLPSLDAAVLSKMRALRLLFLYGTKLSGTFEKHGGLIIRWLKWENCPYEPLPKQLSVDALEFITVLELKYPE